MKILIIIFLLFLFSCEKTGNTTIKGRFYNGITGEPISDVTQSIEKVNTGANQSNKIIRYGQPNENGEYCYTFIWTGHNYIFYPLTNTEIAEKYWGENLSNFQIPKKETTVRDYALYPYGYIRFKLVNLNCFDNSDEIIVYRDNEAGYLASNISFSHNGCNSFDPGLYEKYAMGHYYLSWEVTKNNITTIHYDTIYLNQGDSILYEINY
ncbi:MAG: hypothetical protein R2799_12480 [Crocinitomicaceae bacterium]